MISSFLTIVLLVWWSIFTFIPTTPAERISNACHPVTTGIGKIAAAPVRVTLGEEVASLVTSTFVDARNYCVFTVWEGFYGDEYRRQHGLPPTASLTYEKLFAGPADTPEAPDMPTSSEMPQAARVPSSTPIETSLPELKR